MAMIEERHYPSRLQARGYGGRVERLAQGLGWFSVGLGIAEVLAPDKVGQLIGMHDQTDRRILLRLYGFREIGVGIGILSRPSPVAGMWSRVAGDLIDLATLGAIMGSQKNNRTKAGIAAAAVLGVTALDMYCSQQLSRAPSGYGRVRMTKTIIINRSPEEVYSFWQNYQNFSKLVDHLESVEKTGEKVVHWKVAAPGGVRVEWDAEVESERTNALIAWKSKEGADIDNAGSVRFERATGGRGTLVKVDMAYTAPGGKIGAALAKLFTMEPGQMVETALRRMKQILETGDIVRSDASIHAGMHPALPPAGRRRAALPGKSGQAAALPRPTSENMEVHI